MKKLFILLASTTVALSSCNLDLVPPTALRGEDAATAEYVEAVRVGLYSGLKAITSGGYLYYADYHTDLFNETTTSGNRGGFFARWLLYDTDQDVNSIWNGYYARIRDINYAMDILDRFELNDETGEYDTYIAICRAEFHMLRAYTLHQVALRFCEDYDPAKADQQLGVPTPETYDVDDQLPRKTLKDTYDFILKDIEDATDLELVNGEQNSFYLTKDALTAFKAQVALQMHDYENASKWASSLYAAYPLVSTADALEKMWREDSSSENILRLEVSSTTLATVGSMEDYYRGSWDDNSQAYLCQPAYVPTKKVAQAYDEEKDLRFGIYVDNSYVINNNKLFKGVLMTKFVGNDSFKTSSTVYTYKNMPKVFRIAEMYLIDAEAQYRLGGDAATPLNALREKRGLDATDATGEALFEEIKIERLREMIGEGHRLTDLKRWGDGFTQDYQEAFGSCLRTLLNPVTADNYQFVWPIPQEETSKNHKFGDQNKGY